MYGKAGGCCYEGETMIFPVFYLVAILFGALGLAGAIVAGSAQRKTWLMLKEARTSLAQANLVEQAQAKPGTSGLIASGPYRTLAPPSEATEEDPVVEIMTALESRPWIPVRTARDNDNRSPWVHVYRCGRFRLTHESELMMDDVPIGVPEAWIKAMRERIADEVAGKVDGPTRRNILSGVAKEIKQIEATNSDIGLLPAKTKVAS